CKPGERSPWQVHPGQQGLDERLHHRRRWADRSPWQFFDRGQARCQRVQPVHRHESALESADRLVPGRIDVRVDGSNVQAK
ncbi:unnamed protein product, partial [Symbiodinium sp. CCMP2456]